MKRAWIAGLLVLCGVGLAHAQDYYFAFRGAFIDTAIAVPCELHGAASMTVYDRSAWVVFTCADRVILRRFENPNDNAIAPQPVYSVPNPSQPAAGNATIACPASGHPACRVLPQGTYNRAWADSVR